MNQSRREFFKQALGVAGAAVAAPVILKSLWPAIAQAQGAPKFVVPGQGMAASVNYSENKKSVPKDLAIERNGVKFANQTCSGCVLFTKNAGDANGKCALFPNEQVKATSWCKSWSKKPS